MSWGATLACLYSRSFVWMDATPTQECIMRASRAYGEKFSRGYGSLLEEWRFLGDGGVATGGELDLLIERSTVL